ncbi:hypothetical protein B5S31_g5021 [[Candida] boidinii]|nr:hypothetical protein B5S31_g5021 [[Candida] boidinii]OWB80861.1 hypothetical protein B5S32_g5176 [[Candida] boidinii]
MSSDSIDRVFVKAITTIRTLSSKSSNNSLPRPPLSNRVKLYGLYKQATEGDVSGLMDRPTGNKSEDESSRRKWDAWKSEEGLTKTEAKKRYISYLIQTMNAYALGSNEARELLNELEYLWDQVKDHSNSIIINGSGSGGSNTGSNQQQQHNQQLHNNNSPPFNDLNMFNNNNNTNNNNTTNTIPLLDHGINRSQSPALSLYRLASTGSNTNLVRPISRLSMTNVTQQQQQPQLTQLQATPSAQTTNHTLTHQQQSNYKNQNQNQIVSDYEKYKSRNVSNISTLGYNNPNNNSNNNIDFIKWQSDINITLNRITKELNTLRVIQQHTQNQMTIYDSKDINNDQTKANLRHDDGNKNTNKNKNQSFLRLIITKLKKSIILNFLNFIKIIKLLIKRITIDSILIISIFIIFNKLLKTDFNSLLSSDINLQSSNNNNNNNNNANKNVSNSPLNVITRFITLLKDKFTDLIINHNSIISAVQPKDIIPTNVIIESRK